MCPDDYHGKVPQRLLNEHRSRFVEYVFSGLSYSIHSYCIYDLDGVIFDQFSVNFAQTLFPATPIFTYIFFGGGGGVSSPQTFGFRDHKELCWIKSLSLYLL